MNFILCDEKLDYPTTSPMLRIAAGEANKSIETAQLIWQFLLSHHATRQDTLVCVGGGSLLDLGGFVASTYKRGMRCTYVPTTLLAMADASIGGKTAINFQGTKNSIGTFSLPNDTLIDLHWLDTLPYKDFLCGMAEVLKMGLLTNEENVYAALRCIEDGKIALDLLTRIREYKTTVCEYDPLDKNERQYLNLGHTIGHALEALSIYKSTSTNSLISHGFAVLYGLVAALYLSVVYLGLNKKYLQTLSHFMVEYYGRPAMSCRDYEQLLQLMLQDKKNTEEGYVRFTLLTDIGRPTMQQMSKEKIKEALEYLFSV